MRNPLSLHEQAEVVNQTRDHCIGQRHVLLRRWMKSRRKDGAGNVDFANMGTLIPQTGIFIVMIVGKPSNYRGIVTHCRWCADVILRLWSFSNDVCAGQVMIQDESSDCVREERHLQQAFR